ncbi:MAG: DUF5615 family PIN-like protein [Sporichthya sp.]|nr:DUF5615 family PIN-like protein [Sporichthya sp.]
MFPAAVCPLLRERGHDALHVFDLGLGSRPDTQIIAAALADGRVIVTENVADFAAVPEFVVFCVRKSKLTARPRAAALADLIDAWARTNPDPYRGLHWPEPLADPETPSAGSGA